MVCSPTLVINDQLYINYYKQIWNLNGITSCASDHFSKVTHSRSEKEIFDGLELSLLFNINHWQSRKKNIVYEKMSHIYNDEDLLSQPLSNTHISPSN